MHQPNIFQQNWTPQDRVIAIVAFPILTSSTVMDLTGSGFQPFCSPCTPMTHHHTTSGWTEAVRNHEVMTRGETCWKEVTTTTTTPTTTTNYYSESSYVCSQESRSIQCGSVSTCVQWRWVYIDTVLRTPRSWNWLSRRDYSHSAARRCCSPSSESRPRHDRNQSPTNCVINHHISINVEKHWQLKMSLKNDISKLLLYTIIYIRVINSGWQIATRVHGAKIDSKKIIKRHKNHS